MKASKHPDLVGRYRECAVLDELRKMGHTPQVVGRPG